MMVSWSHAAISRQFTDKVGDPYGVERVVGPDVCFRRCGSVSPNVPIPDLFAPFPGLWRIGLVASASCYAHPFC